MPESEKSLKLAEQLAHEIRREIVAGALQPGTNLGLEPDLIERYKVGRGVLREAIRILEHLSIVEMRRGRTGGLVVTEPDRRSVELAMSTYLDFQSVTHNDVAEVRLMLELTAVDRLIECASDERLRELRERIPTQILSEYETSFHVALAEATGNPVLHLLTDVVVQTSQIRFLAPPQISQPATSELIRVHGEIADALIRRDRERAHYLVTAHLRAIARQWAS
ncbi:MAG TPA: FCD domain-containing protein [Acidimicrobiales bacterium]|nr:FCD domain-containing protein [Acidimicrobiales bacterium]